MDHVKLLEYFDIVSIQPENYIVLPGEKFLELSSDTAKLAVWVAMIKAHVQIRRAWAHGDSISYAMLEAGEYNIRSYPRCIPLGYNLSNKEVVNKNWEESMLLTIKHQVALQNHIRRCKKNKTSPWYCPVELRRTEFLGPLGASWNTLKQINQHMYIELRKSLSGLSRKRR